MRYAQSPRGVDTCDPRRAVEGAMRRIAPKRVEQAIGEAAAIDRAIKGVEVREPWEAFLHLGLNLAGGAKA